MKKIIPNLRDYQKGEITYWYFFLEEKEKSGDYSRSCLTCYIRLTLSCSLSLIPQVLLVWLLLRQIKQFTAVEGSDKLKEANEWREKFAENQKAKINGMNTWLWLSY